MCDIVSAGNRYVNVLEVLTKYHVLDNKGHFPDCGYDGAGGECKCADIGGELHEAVH